MTQLEFTTRSIKDRTLITKVTFDKPNLKRIVEAQKRIVGKGVYQPSKEYLQYKARLDNKIFPKEPARESNLKRIDGFLSNLFTKQVDNQCIIRKRKAI